MRPSVIVAALGMVAACSGLMYLHSTKQSYDATPVTAASAAASPQASLRHSETLSSEAPPSSVATATAGTASASEIDDATSTTTAAERPDTLEQWIKDTQNSDPKIRAAAIAKLGSAPKAQALPVLKNVLETGEPEVDRHIALNSLHSLALRDGDKNGQVRDVMRSAIYHSDNDGVMQTAQSLLDDVEAALAEQQQD